MLVQHDGGDLDAAEAELWFASKKLPLDAKLSQYVGRNEKTKARTCPAFVREVLFCRTGSLMAQRAFSEKEKKKQKLIT